MESFSKSTTVADQETYEDVGGRKFDVKIEEFEFNLLNDFRCALKSVDNLKCPMNDAFLLRFLRTRKHNVAEAVKTVRQYFGMRKRFSETLGTPFSRIKKFLDTNYLRVLKNRDQNGSIILNLKTVQWNPKVFTFDEVMATIYYITEEITTIKEVQEAGIVCIIDCSGLTVSHAAEIAKELSIKQFRKIVTFYQGAFPAKFKKVIVFGLPMVITAVYAVAKYLIKYKLHNRIHPSSLGPEFIHDHIFPNLLPLDLGGTLTNEEAIDTTFIDSVIKNEPYYRAIGQFGYAVKSTDNL